MCSDWVEGLDAALGALAGEDLDCLSDRTLAGSLVQLRRVVDGLEGQWLRRLAAFDAHGGAVAAGAVSTGAWVRSNTRLSAGVARDRVELARALAGLPETSAALAAGEISVLHARLIATALGELAEAAGAQLAGETEPALVDLARVVDPARLR